MVGIFALPPHHDDLQYMYHVYLMQMGQNSGWLQQLTHALLTLSKSHLDCVPLPHRLARLCRDLSHACIGMIKSHLLIHTARMTFGPLSTILTWGIEIPLTNQLTILSFFLRSFSNS